MKALIEWFRDSGIAQALAFLVSVCALAVSIWAVCTSRKANRKAGETQARLVPACQRRRHSASLTEVRSTSRRTLRGLTQLGTSCH